MVKREGWQKAVDAAWRAFGTRYWRVIVGVSIAGRVLPWLAGAFLVAAGVYGVVWLVRHAPSPSAPDVHLSFDWLPQASIALAVLLILAGAGFLAYRWWNPEAELTARRVGATVVTALAAVALWTWQRT